MIWQQRNSVARTNLLLAVSQKVYVTEKKFKIEKSREIPYLHQYFSVTYTVKKIFAKKMTCNFVKVNNLSSDWAIGSLMQYLFVHLCIIYTYKRSCSF